MFRSIVLFALTLSTLCTYSQKLTESYYWAQAAIARNDLLEALNWADSAIADLPRQPEVWIKKGEVFYRANKPDSALVYFYGAEDIRDGSASIWLARCYSVLGNKTKTFEYLEKHLASQNKEFESAIKLDTAFLAVSNDARWSEIWLQEWYNRNELLAAEVAYHFSLGEWDFALDLLNERMDGRKARHSFYALRGKAFYNVGSYKAAEADFAQALKRNRRNHSYMFWLGKTLLAKGNHKKSERYFSQAIKQSGGEPEYYKYRAMAFASNQEYQRAYNDIKHYLQFYPNDKKAQLTNIDISIQLGRNIDALLTINNLIKREPNIWEYYKPRGLIYLKSKNWEIAELDFSKAIEMGGGNDKDLFLHRGNCRFYQNKTNKACTDWKQAIELGSFSAQELVYKNCKR